MSRIALVTGGTRGLGRAMAVALKAEGHEVAVSYHSNEAAAEAFRAQTGIHAERWDVSDFAACKSGIERIESALGPVDILVNNAGITGDAPLHKMDPQVWRRVIGTNLDSLFNMCRNVIDGMRERSFGRIVNVSSINGQKGQFGQCNYAASKAGILGFTRSLALEGARRGITVNAIAPGYCDTDMLGSLSDDILKKILATIPVGHLGQPECVARMVAYLVRDDSDFITGATFSINGGQLMV
jgi:acetoacetyl-CoA reductase